MSITSLHNTAYCFPRCRGGIPTSENDRYTLLPARPDVYEIVGLLKANELEVRREYTGPNSESNVEYTESQVQHIALLRTVASLLEPIASIWQRMYNVQSIDAEMIACYLQSQLSLLTQPSQLDAESSSEVDSATILANVFTDKVVPSIYR